MRTTNRLSRLMILVMTLAVLLAACGSAGGGAASNTETATLNVYGVAGGASGNNVSFFVAQHMGYFKQEHVEVKYTDNGGATFLDQLVSGEADLIGITAQPGLQLVVKGIPVSYIFLQTATFGLPSGINLAGNKETPSLSALKADGTNCTIASPPAATVGYAFVHEVMSREGLQCRWVAAPSWPLQAQGVIGGTYTAAVTLLTNAPDITAAGGHILINGGDPAVARQWPSMSSTSMIYGEPANLKKKKVAIVGMLKALLKAYSYMKKESETTEGLKRLVEIAKVEDSSGVARATPLDTSIATLKLSIPGMFPPGVPVGYITPEVWNQMLSLLPSYGVPALAGGSAIPSLAYAKRVDMSYLNDAKKK